MANCLIIIVCLLQGVNDVKLKDGVRIAGIRPEMTVAMMVVDAVYRKHDRELVVTSAVEGAHSKTSRHYLGMAIDCRTFFFDQSKIPQIMREIQNALGDDFYVEFEGDHFHIQFSPKALTV